MNLACGYEIAALAAVEGARPDTELLVDEWSEQHMVLPKSSSEPGPYRIERTPAARRVMQVLSPGHPCKRVVVRGASQMLKTQVALNWIGASIHRAPANILALEPTDKLAKRLSARIAQAGKDSSALRERIAQPRSRDSRNTIDAKEFPGGTLYIVTAGAASNLAEIPARYVFLDEVDRMERSVDGEGDPVELAEARTTTFSSNCKIYAVSSPTIKGFSKIDELYQRGTQEVYLVPCPHCEHLHELDVERFRYARDEETGHLTRAWFVCPECGCEIDEHHKGWMLRDEAMGGLARWHAQSPGDGETISFHISAFYASPGFITWLQLARQLDRARERKEKGDHDGMRVFWNTRLALSYDDATDRPSIKALMDRPRCAPRVVPDRALVLTAFVDTQPTRLEVQIEAWGPDLEHWVVDHTVLWGDPTDPPWAAGSVWQRLDEIIRTPLAHERGVPIRISAYGIDSGGANTQDVYNYGSARQHLHCLVTKGASRPNRPIIAGKPTPVDVDWQGNKVDGGVLLWILGTEVAKDHLYHRFKLSSGPGAMHFNSALPQEWFEQLVVERRIVVQLTGRAVVRYVKQQHERNEALDLAVGNLAIAHHLGLHKWAARDWQMLRDRLIPQAYTPDLFAIPAPPADAPAPPAHATPEHDAPSAPAEPAPDAAEAPSALATGDPPPTPTPSPQSPPPSPAPPPTLHPPPVPQPAYPPATHTGRRIYSRGIS